MAIADQHPDAADGPRPLVTVALGSYNGARTLTATLDALEAQVTDVNYEVIVVDDASTDATAELATRPGVQLVRLERNQGHGHTLNVALERARGEFLVQLDDDCVPPPTWLQTVVDTWRHVDDGVKVIGGVVVPLETDTFNRRYVRYRRPITHQEAGLSEHAGLLTRLRFAFWPPRPLPGPRPVYFTVGANMSVRVEAALEVGGFTEARGGGEEESLVKPLRARYGPAIAWLFPDLVMFHDFAPGLGDTLRRARSYGRSHGRDWLRDRDLPTISPRPLLGVTVAAALLFWNGWAALGLLCVSPLALYHEWFRFWRRHPGAEVLAYPYVHFVEDLSGNLGFVQGVWRELRHGDTKARGR